MKTKRANRVLINDNVMTIKINQILKADLQFLADAKGITLSSLVRMALMEYVNNNKKGRR